jgi:hypothetical protein
VTAVADPAGGLCNLRDLGGLPTVDGGRTRAGILYRSDLPLAALDRWRATLLGG